MPASKVAIDVGGLDQLFVDFKAWNLCQTKFSSVTHYSYVFFLNYELRIFWVQFRRVQFLFIIWNFLPYSINLSQILIIKNVLWYIKVENTYIYIYIWKELYLLAPSLPLIQDVNPWHFIWCSYHVAASWTRLFGVQLACDHVINIFGLVAGPGLWRCIGIRRFLLSVQWIKRGWI